MRDQNQAWALEKWLQSISTEFADRILPVDERVADQWGRLGLRRTDLTPFLWANGGSGLGLIFVPCYYSISL